MCSRSSESSTPAASKATAKRDAYPGLMPSSHSLSERCCSMERALCSTSPPPVGLSVSWLTVSSSIQLSSGRGDVMSAGAAWPPFAPSAIAGSQLNICIVRLQGGCSDAEGTLLVKSKSQACQVKSRLDMFLRNWLEQ